MPCMDKKDHNYHLQIGKKKKSKFVNGTLQYTMILKHKHKSIFKHNVKKKKKRKKEEDI